MQHCRCTHLHTSVHTYVLSYTYGIILYWSYNLDIAGRKQEVMHYIDEITSALNGIDNINVLDRMLSLLMQAASSSRIPTHDTTQIFTVKDHFAPAQKNKIQLQFKRTCTNPGRKAKPLIMRYNKLFLCINRYNRIVVV